MVGGGHQRRSHLASLDLDALGGDLGIPDVPHPLSARSSRSSLPPRPAASASAPTAGDIRFRAEPHQRQTLYEGEAEEEEEEEADPTNGLDDYIPRPELLGRKHSLVRVEDYMPQQIESDRSASFNPYRATSWSSKPEEFNLDLASPATSPTHRQQPQYASQHAQGEEDKQELEPSMAIDMRENFSLAPSPPRHKMSLEYDTLGSKSDRTLGGKKVVSGAEWRKKLQLDPHRAAAARHSGSSFDEKFGGSNIYLDKLPAPKVVDLQRHQPLHGLFARSLLLLAPAVALLLNLATVAYLAARLVYLVMADLTTHAHSFGAWAFWVVEFVCAWKTGLAMTKAAFTYKRNGVKKLRMQGDAFLPTVDVLVISTGQPDQVVMDTAMAASRLDWPVDRIRVLVVDDTPSPELQRRLEAYASHKALHMSYHRRNKTASSGREETYDPNLKASLINFGLTETRIHGRQAGDFTLVLEAECIPEPDILRAMAPWLVQDAKVALVRSQQGFYNLPLRMNAAFGTFINAVEPLEDARSGFLMRRAAVDNVGGFPTSSTIEDRQLQCLLEGQGYKTLFVQETLQYGLVPDSFALHLKMRLARNAGFLRTARRLKCFFSSRLPEMGFFSRIAHLYTAVLSIYQLDLFISMVIFPFALFFGEFLVPVMNIEQLYLLIRCLFIMTILRRLHELMFCVPSGQPTGDRLQQQWIFLAPYQLVNYLRAVVPWGGSSSKASMRWTSDATPRERDTVRKQPTTKRAKSIFASWGTWLHLVVAGAVLAGIIFTLVVVLAPVARHERSARQAFLMVLLTFGWPSLPWINVLASSMVSLSYILSAPSVPARDHLLHREPITGIARPLPERRQNYPFRSSSKSEVVVTTLSTLYIVALFGLTFTDVLRI